MSSYQEPDPSWPGPDGDEDDQNRNAYHDDPDASPFNMMESNLDYHRGLSMSSFGFGSQFAETPAAYYVSNSCPDYGASAVAHGTCPPFDGQHHTLDDHGYPETPDQSVTPTDTSNPEFSIRRVDTSRTDHSIQAQQGSVFDGLSDSDDNRQEARRRDPAHRDDAYDRHDAPPPIGSRFPISSNGPADSMSDTVFSTYNPEQTPKKKEKRGKYKEASSSYDTSSSSRHKKKRRDHEDRDPSGQRWSNETGRR